MFCFIYKWFIPDMNATGKEKSRVHRYTRRHLDHCASCRSFATITTALSLKLSQDTKQLLHDTPSSFAKELNKKINDKINDKINEKAYEKENLTLLPITLPSGLSVGSFSFRSFFKLPALSLRPIMVSALGLVVLVSIMIILTTSRHANISQPFLPQPTEISIATPQLTTTGTTIQTLSVKVESSFHTEINRLEAAVKSTRKFLGDNLPIQL